MNKKNLGLYFLYLLVVLSSCEDEFVADNTNCYDNVTFGVKIGSDQQISSRAADEAQPLKEITVKDISSEFRGKPLYLHTIVQDYKPQEEKTQKNEKQSRGAVRDKDAVTDLGVSGVIYNEDWTESGRDDQILYFYNLDLDVTNYTASTNYYWPMQNEKMRVFAYSPYSASGMSGFTKTAVSPSFDYEVPAEAADQVDLLVASNEVAKAEYGDPIDLTFGHALTAIQVGIKTDVNDVTIKSVKILNVKSAGSYTFNYDKDKDANPDTEDVKCRELGAWTGQNKIVESYNVPLTDIPEGKSDMVIPADITSDVIFNKEDDILMLMPQQLDGAKLQITLVDNKEGENYNKEVTKTIDLTGEWIKGQHLIYYLSASDLAYEYVLEVFRKDAEGNEISANNEFEFYGGIGEFYVRSYKRTTNGFGRTEVTAVPWEINNNDMPIGLTKMVLKGDGVDKATKAEGPFSYTVLPNLEGAGSSSHNTLKDKVVHGTKVLPYDLSYDNGNGDKIDKRHTANCYVVSSPGYYMLPLVYGNAIKDGNDNSSAYFSEGTTEIEASHKSYIGNLNSNNAVYYVDNGTVTITVNRLREMLDHANKPIKNTWIREQSNTGVDYIPTEAEIVWQDEPWLITELELCDEAGKTAGEDGVGTLNYIRFRAHEQSICEGNALIAVKNSKNEIMWSWHIWFTDIWIQSKSIWNRRITAGPTSGDDVSISVGATPKWGTYQEGQFHLMLSQIGFCDPETKNYAKRNINVKVSQVDNNPFPSLDPIYKNFTITENDGVTTTVPNAPYYQWGRKDPMLPCSKNGVDKPYYDNDGVQYTTIKVEDGAMTVGESIQNPDKFIKGASVTSGKVTYRNWCSTVYINLWNNNIKMLPMYSDRYRDRVNVHSWDFHKAFGTNETQAISSIGYGSKNVEKTVYDPSPARYELPRVDAFSGVTYEGVNEAPYYTTDISNGWIYDSPFYPLINIAHQRPTDSDVFELALCRFPMIEVDSRDIGTGYSESDYNPNLFWIVGFGYRDTDSKVTSYNTFINLLTEGIMCIQWSADDSQGNELPFELTSSRLCIIRNNSSTNKVGGYGTMRPFSGSEFQKSFNIIPALTGSNPIPYGNEGGVQTFYGNETRTTKAINKGS